jgi:hypothetical protein
LITNKTEGKHMQATYKKLIFANMAALLLLSFSPTSPMENVAGPALRVLNGVGAVGSLASFAFWMRPTLAFIQHNGFLGAVASTHIPRLAVDATCVAASAYGSGGSQALNIMGLLGSTASLVSWGPYIVANANDPFFLARAVIDLAQIGLCASRLL